MFLDTAVNRTVWLSRGSHLMRERNSVEQGQNNSNNDSSEALFDTKANNTF